MISVRKTFYSSLPSHFLRRSVDGLISDSGKCWWPDSLRPRVWASRDSHGFTLTADLNAKSPRLGPWNGLRHSSCVSLNSRYEPTVGGRIREHGLVRCRLTVLDWAECANSSFSVSVATAEPHFLHFNPPRDQDGRRWKKLAVTVR